MLPQAQSTTADPISETVKADELAGIVNRALSEPVRVLAWQVSLLGGLDSSPLAGGVYRVWGTAVTHTNVTKEWSVVVKILRSPTGLTLPNGKTITPEMAENQSNFGYWQREVMVAQSDLFAALPKGLVAPRCLGVTPIHDGECWLWQEYLPEDHEWSWTDYQEAAFRLGRWQATHQGQMPNYPWLGRDGLAGWVHGPLTGIFSLVTTMNGWQHRLLSAYFAPEELAALRQLWTDRQIYLDRLAQLPKALCHLDAHRGNLRWQADDLALLDWAFVGEGTLGEELAAFVGASLLLDYVPLVEAEQLEETAFHGYIAGLRAAGWSGEESDIEEAYRNALPLRYAPVSLASMLRTAVQPEFAADWERRTGKSLADILAHRAGLIRFYLSRR